MSAADHCSPSAQTSRVKSCTSCRQDKARCDRQDNLEQPCSRCRRLGKECLFTPKFSRKKRQTKAQLTEELARLRAHVEFGNSSKAHDVSEAWLDASADANRHHDGLVSLSNAQANPSPSVIQHDSPHDRTTTQRVRSQGQTSSIHDSRSWMIDDVEVHGQAATDCFRLFFRHYYSALSDLSLEKEPEKVYKRSPLLFWTIICVGSQRYTQDRAIFMRLPDPILKLAKDESFNLATNRVIFTIIAISILCLYPLPTGALWYDPTTPLAGAALQLAIQSGLHLASQNDGDFPYALMKHSEDERLFRTRLWAACLIVFQGVNLMQGLPQLSVPLSTCCSPATKEIGILSETLAYRLALHEIQTEFVDTMLQTIDPVSSTAGETICAFISSFESRVAQISRPEDDISKFDTTSARLFIRGSHFLRFAESKRTFAVANLYGLSGELILLATKMDQHSDFAYYMTRPQWCSLILAGCIILRIERASALDIFPTMGSGREALDRLLKILRKRSLGNGDLDERMMVILESLRKSDTAFKVLPNGETIEDPLKLQICGRLSMGIVFDTIYYFVQRVASALENSKKDEHQPQPQAPDDEIPREEDGRTIRAASGAGARARVGQLSVTCIQNLVRQTPNVFASASDNIASASTHHGHGDLSWLDSVGPPANIEENGGDVQGAIQKEGTEGREVTADKILGAGFAPSAWGHL